MWVTGDTLRAGRQAVMGSRCHLEPVAAVSPHICMGKALRGVRWEDLSAPMLALCQHDT